MFTFSFLENAEFYTVVSITFPEYCALEVNITFIFWLMFRNSSEYAARDNPSNFFCLDGILSEAFSMRSGHPSHIDLTLNTNTEILHFVNFFLQLYD